MPPACTRRSARLTSLHKLASAAAAGRCSSASAVGSPLGCAAMKTKSPQHASVVSRMENETTSALPEHGVLTHHINEATTSSMWCLLASIALHGKRKNLMWPCAFPVQLRT